MEEKKYNRMPIRISKINCTYGYQFDPVKDCFFVDSVKSEVIKRIFDERIQGISLRQIAHGLIEDEIVTAKGGTWQANTIKKILENIQYTGNFYYKKKIFKNTHIPIISEEEFLKANGIEKLEDLIWKSSSL